MDQAAVQALLRKHIENELGKVHGMEWAKEEDVIQFQLCNIDNEEKPQRDYACQQYANYTTLLGS